MPPAATQRKPPRCFLSQCATAPAVDDLIEITTPQYRHLISAFRRGNGDPVAWFDGTGAHGAAVLEGSDRSGFSLRIQSVDHVETEPAQHLTLWLGIPKRDGIERCLAGATEVGVGSIVLITAERTPWKITSSTVDKQLPRWEQTVIDSAEQCGRLTVPPVQVTSLPELLNSAPSARMVVGCTPDESGLEPAKIWGLDQPTILAIGPEGGWSAVELEAFSTAGARCLHLAGTVLTTVSACAVLPAQLRWGALPDGKPLPITRW